MNADKKSKLKESASGWPDDDDTTSKFRFSLKTQAFLDLFNQAPAGIVLPLDQRGLQEGTEVSRVRFAIFFVARFPTKCEE